MSDGPAGEPRTRPCKFDGEPIIYDPREDLWTPQGLHKYGRHDGPCGRKLVLLRLTPGTPPGFEQWQGTANV